jgi:predicted RNA-binding protein with PIN domain
MAEPTLYVFDGYNLMHSGGIETREELVDRLAGFVALKGARGIVVFDGGGTERRVGPLEVRFAAHADELIERLVAGRRLDERVAVVSSDTAIRETAGPIVQRIASRQFLRELESDPSPRAPAASGRFQIEGAIDAETREKLERLRRQR